MAVTIKDVAREAGVSVTTVSKVINGSPSISQATTDNVRAVMERLEYIPNQHATNLARASTKNIAFLTTLRKGQAFDYPHMFEIICGAENELEKSGYTLTLIDASREVKIGETAKKIILKKSADGIIIHDVPINRNIADFIIKKEFPHMVVGKPDFLHSVSWTDTNNILSGEIAARHLYQSGYSGIAFIGGKTDSGSVIPSHRLQGAQSFLQEHSAEIKEEYICHINYDVNESYGAMVSLLNKNNRPDAVICENNLIAVGVMNALKDKGIAIPKEIGVIMIDDNPYSKVITPAPTVVNIDVYDLGVQIIRNLIRKIKKPALQIQTYTTLPELIVRDTTRQR
ncbi:MAG: LacI family transcriptional regulator [Oscillospiraceae bacterium]|nr:LacI family transcriptional regulator [Oscillospiraceae bacterium]